ncbi:MAG: substrate-binding protein [Candidatus Nanopelagicales bacterium]
MSGDPPSLTIAAVLPLSGPESLFGHQSLQGARMAVAEINAAGGVRGRRVDLVVHDQRTETQLAVDQTRAALADGAFAILGPTSSADRDAMLPLCEQARRPLLYATDYEGGQCSRYLFCYSPIPEHYLKPLVPFLIERSGDRFALIGADYVWPRGIGRALRTVVEARGGTLDAEIYRPMEQMDFAADLEALDGAGTVVVVLLGASGQSFLQQFAAHEFAHRPRLAVMAFNENYMAGLPSDVVEGIVTAVPFLESLDLPEARDFVARQRAMFGPDAVVSYFAESHYGLLMFLRDAIEAVGSDDVEAVIDAMGDRTRTVGNGPVTLRASDHHMILNMVIAEVRDGELLAVQDVGRIAPPDQCAGSDE